jgi:pyruvate dehydrogenase E2 component (dihydrolipoamide acetyltransferase)
VGMEDGLAVPVLLNAQDFTLPQLAVETKRLANQARAGKIENMGQGIFTISNLGMFGVDEFSAIINPPEASILAVSAVREDVIVKDGALKAGQTMNLTLSADHRLIDGTLGAQFMARLKALLENPIQLIA